MPTTTNKAPLVDASVTSVSAPKKNKEETNPVLRAAAALVGDSTAPSSTSDSTTTTTTTRKTEKTFANPTTPGPLKTVTDALALGQELEKEGAKEIEKLGAKETDINNVIAKSLLGEAADLIGIKEQAKRDLMKRELESKKVYTAGGGTPRFTELQERRQLAARHVEETQLAVATANKDWNFFQKLFGMGDLIEEANIAEATLAKYDNMILGYSRSVNAADSTIDKMTTTVTEATINAQSNIILAEQTQKALAAQRDAVKSNAKAVKEGLESSSRITALKLAEFKILNEAVTSEKTIAISDRQLQNLAKNKKLLAARNEAHFFGKVATGELVVREDKIYGADDTFVADTADPASMAKLATDLELEYETNKERSLYQINVALDKTEITASDRFTAAFVGNKKELLEGDNKALNLMREAKVKADENLLTKKIPKPTKADREAEYNNTFPPLWKAANDKIIASDTDNPNHLPPLKGLIELSPVLQKLPLYTKVLAPYLGTNSDITMDKIIELSINEVKTEDNPTGTITFNQYVNGLKAIIDKGMEFNNNDQKRKLNKLPLQTEYNIVLDSVRPKFAPFSFTDLGSDELSAEDIEYYSIPRIVDMSDSTVITFIGLRFLTLKGKISTEGVETILENESKGETN